METEAKVDLKTTITLPDTTFPLRGNLAQREPARLKKWEEMDVYERLREARAGFAQPLINVHLFPLLQSRGFALRQIASERKSRIGKSDCGFEVYFRFCFHNSSCSPVGVSCGLQGPLK